MPFIMAVHHLARPIFVLSVDESAERPGALRDSFSTVTACATAVCASCESEIVCVFSA